MIRSLFVTVVTVAVIAALAGQGPAGETAGLGHAGSSRGPGRATAPAGAARNAGVIPAKLDIRLSRAQLRAAASRCAAWATEAGFANNGYQGGSLTTAVAVALGESGCDPAACYDDTTGQECTQAGTRGSHDSIDRGAWQLNSHAWKNVSGACAFRGRCNARVAYRQVSAYGSYFGPWTIYLTDRFAGYMWAAQQAVSALRRGTIASALIGFCAAYPADRAGAQVRLADCGTAAADRMWTTSAGTLRTSAGLCLGATSARPGPVTVQSCTGSRLQNWRHKAGSTLHNTGARLCLTDPGSSLTPGHGLTDGSCGRRQDTAWFRP